MRMDNLSFSIRDWLTAEEDTPELRETTGWLEIRAGKTILTRNEDVWSRTVRDAVLVSAWPLAYWLAWNWWRLNWEPLPVTKTLSLNWRMAHELGAANQGYVWPRISFASDGESIQILAEPFIMPGQSVQYLSGLDEPYYVPLQEFQSAIDGFIGMVLARLAAVGLGNSDLDNLWKQVCKEREDEEIRRQRQLEARLGFDPDQCPANLLSKFMALQATTGDAAMAELAPAYGPRSEAVDEIKALEHEKGVPLAPQVEPIEATPSSKPWQAGVEIARHLRKWLGNPSEPIRDEELLDLLGIARQANLDETTNRHRRRPVSVMRASTEKKFVFLPRKRHPIARRFELARILGDWLIFPQIGHEWRVSSDVCTARQKRQRAFAAKFLCPTEALTQFLGGDFSDTAIEEASEYFAVSEITVKWLLVNNCQVPDDYAVFL